MDTWVWEERWRRTLKISSPLLLRRALVALMSSGSGTSGVSIRSFRPYLCGLSSGSGEGAGMLGDRAESRCLRREEGLGEVSLSWGTGRVGTSSPSTSCSVMRDSLRLSALHSQREVDPLSGCLAFSSGMVTVEAECTGGGGAPSACGAGDSRVWVPSMNGFTGFSSFSSSASTGLSRVVGETCCLTWITVPVSSGGRGDLESMRLKRLVELLRRTRTGLRTTLCVLALSGSGSPVRLDCEWPMGGGRGVFGARFGRERGTCVFVSQLPVRPSQICCFK